MTGPTPPLNMADLALAFAEASRRAQSEITDLIIPALPAARRVFAQDIARRLACQALPTERAVQDLDAFVIVVEREAGFRTRLGWEADEHHVRGGWQTVHRDEDGIALAQGAVTLRELLRASERLLDGLAAERLAAMIDVDEPTS